ncbi:MAG: hypothetical protein NTZ92_04090 [Candidatus Omnitrophica bacterium]|nr:hypothetical protein [Candidatus Omnitrophota bacterium]
MKSTIIPVALFIIAFSITPLKAQNGAFPATVLELKEQIIELQNKGTLGIKNFLPCSQISTLGSYTILGEAKFKQNETLYVYFEPVNFSTSKTNGKYEIWLTEDIMIQNDKKETLMEKPGIMENHYMSDSPILDIYFNNHVEFDNVPAGKYIFKVILYDKLKNTSASESLPFEVVEEQKPAEQQK